MPVKYFCYLQKIRQPQLHWLSRFVIWVVSWRGTFCDGILNAGSFRDLGPFVIGSFRDGTLCDGSFCDGSFRDGTFCMWIEYPSHQWLTIETQFSNSDMHSPCFASSSFAIYREFIIYLFQCCGAASFLCSSGSGSGWKFWCGPGSYPTV
jgi:hypothetical protein